MHVLDLIPPLVGSLPMLGVLFLFMRGVIMPAFALVMVADKGDGNHQGLPLIQGYLGRFLMVLVAYPVIIAVAGLVRKLFPEPKLERIMGQFYSPESVVDYLFAHGVVAIAMLSTIILMVRAQRTFSVLFSQARIPGLSRFYSDEPKDGARGSVLPLYPEVSKSDWAQARETHDRVQDEWLEADRIDPTGGPSSDPDVVSALERARDTCDPDNISTNMSYIAAVATLDRAWDLAKSSKDGQ